MPACMTVRHMHTVAMETKRECWIPWGLALQTAVSYRVGTGPQTQVLRTNISLLTVLSSF